MSVLRSLTIPTLSAAAIVMACDDDTTTSGPSTAFDGGTASSSSSSGASSSSSSSSSSGTSGTSPPTGRYLRFAHLSDDEKADRIEFCLAAPGTQDFKPVHRDLGTTQGLAYGEVGRFVPVQSGEYEVRTTKSGDCLADDFREEGTILIPQLGAFSRHTFALLRTSTGVLNVVHGDLDTSRDPAKGRISVVDGTGPRGATEALKVSWVGSSTIDLSVKNSSRTVTQLVPPGESAKIVISTSESPVRATAGGQILVLAYGTSSMRVCDNDEPIPTTGHLSRCDDPP